MAIATYADLQSAIGRFLNRDDLASASADFIALAEAQIGRDLRHTGMEVNSTLSVSGRYTDLPADFVQPIRLYVDGANEPLALLSYADMQERRAADGDAQGEPRFYCVTAGQIEVWPSPSTTLTVNTYYYGSIPALSDEAATNWLLTLAPDVYLYGSLIHSAPYLGHDQRTTQWAAFYQSAIDALNRTSEQTKFGGGSLRIR